ncbi:MAG TPA: FtsX-like permease family protein [Thermomicrobiaceae bacterium]|nr:FtsX-like permease family protein [Thermomicrobiaceae bacterium]
MNSIYGVSMNTIMVVLLVLFALSLSVSGWVFWRQRIIFRMGLRNVPRRRAQTVLIVIGLMLSTLIVSAALTTGDTLSHSITASVLNLSQHTDELVVLSRNGAKNATPQPGVTFPAQVATDLKAKLAGNPDIAGIAPAYFASVPGMDPRTKLSEPALTVMGIDPATVAPFGQITTVGGQPVDVATLPGNGIALGQKAANALDARVGDTLTVYVHNQPHDLTVSAIVTDWYLTGMLDPSTVGGFAMPLDRAQALFGQPGQISVIGVANRGGVGASDTVTAALSQALAGTPYVPVEITQNALNQAELAGNVFTSIFVGLGLFSIAAGVLLIFLIFVLLAAERKPEMGMARAVGLRRRQLTQMFLAEGTAYDLLAALVGAALGIGVAVVIAGVMGRLIGGFFPITPSASWRSLIVAYTLGVVVTFVTVAVSSWRVSRLNIVRAIRDIPEPAPRRAGGHWLVLGLAAIVLGAVLMVLGDHIHKVFPFSVGISLLPLGVAVMLRRFGLPGRLLYSLAAILVLVYWLLPDSVSSRIFPKLSGGIEMFFVSGVMMVAAATVLIVWNASLATSLVGLLGRAFSRWLPAVKTAVAYPLASRGRTGMTIAMFSLIIFSLVMMATIDANFTQVFTGSQASAGWSIEAAQAPTNPIPNFTQALKAQGVDTSKITALGKLDNVDAGQVQVRVTGTSAWKQYAVNGADAAFLEQSSLPLQTRATGYASDQAAWAAVRDHPDLAIVDAGALAGSGGFGPPNTFVLPGVKTGDKTMAPVTVQLGNPASGTSRTVTIIGVIDTRVSLLTGLFVSNQTFSQIFPQPSQISYYVRTASGVDDTTYAKQIKAALVNYGVQARSFQEIIDQGNAISQGFLKLIEGFMGLGLVVGIAALGVVSFRSVVERRLQIGMLRAIGYRGSMVAASFLIESTMITVLGVLSGTAMAIVLAHNLMTGSQLSSQTGNAPFIIPWLSILAFVAIALGAGLLMSYIPARQASRVPIAEALRYE